MDEKIKILIVDDEMELREVLNTILTQENYSIKEAENGLVAKGMMEKEKFDLIISDIRMPKMDGLELFKWNKSTKNIPTILITGFSELMETQQAYQIGVDEFLAKPFHKGEILAAVRNTLKLGGSEHVNQEKNFHHTEKFNMDSCVENDVFKYDIYLKLPNEKFIKIASKGSPAPVDKIDIQNFKAYGAVILVKTK